VQFDAGGGLLVSRHHLLTSDRQQTCAGPGSRKEFHVAEVAMEASTDLLQHRLREAQGSKRGSDGAEEHSSNKKRRFPDNQVNAGPAAVSWGMRQPQGNREMSGLGWLWGCGDDR